MKFNKTRNINPFKKGTCAAFAALCLLLLALSGAVAAPLQAFAAEEFSFTVSFEGDPDLDVLSGGRVPAIMNQTAVPIIAPAPPSGAEVLYRWEAFMDNGFEEIPDEDGGNGEVGHFPKYSTEGGSVTWLQLTVTVNNGGAETQKTAQVFCINGFIVLYKNADGSTYVMSNQINPDGVIQDQAKEHTDGIELLGWSLTQGSNKIDLEPGQNADLAALAVDGKLFLYAVEGIRPPTVEITVADDPADVNRFILSAVVTPTDGFTVSYQWLQHDLISNSYIDLLNAVNATQPVYAGNYGVRVTVTKGENSAVVETVGEVVGEGVDAYTAYKIGYVDASGEIAYNYVKEGMAHVVADYVAAERAGYTFVGWADVYGSDMAKYSAGDSFSVLEDVTLYAAYSLNPPVLLDPVDNLNAGNVGLPYREDGYQFIFNTEPIIDGAQLYFDWYELVDDVYVHYLTEEHENLFFYTTEGLAKTFGVDIRIFNGNFSSAVSVRDLKVKIFSGTKVSVIFYNHDASKVLRTESVEKNSDYTVADLGYSADGYTFLGWSLVKNSATSEIAVGQLVNVGTDNLSIYPAVTLLPPVFANVSGVDYAYSGDPEMQTAFAVAVEHSGLNYSYRWFKVAADGSAEPYTQDVARHMCNFYSESAGGTYFVEVIVSDGVREATALSPEISVSIRNESVKVDDLLWLWIVLGILGGALLILAALLIIKRKLSASGKPFTFSAVFGKLFTSGKKSAPNPDTNPDVEINADTDTETDFNPEINADILTNFSDSDTDI
ncbi:MAG: InlB B-repeat-containing protein [Clostridiaceae bacterium]|jgi:uncharacterized repeat protein (TIGR02543 family)|nr:InlB B-repeat-containing protein [Clostridiaceae bacterium]